LTLKQALNLRLATFGMPLRQSERLRRVSEERENAEILHGAQNDGALEMSAKPAVSNWIPEEQADSRIVACVLGPAYAFTQYGTL